MANRDTNERTRKYADLNEWKRAAGATFFMERMACDAASILDVGVKLGLVTADSVNPVLGKLAEVKSCFEFAMNEMKKTMEQMAPQFQPDTAFENISTDKKLQVTEDYLARAINFLYEDRLTESDNPKDDLFFKAFACAKTLGIYSILYACLYSYCWRDRDTRIRIFNAIEILNNVCNSIIEIAREACSVPCHDYMVELMRSEDSCFRKGFSGKISDVFIFINNIYEDKLKISSKGTPVWNYGYAVDSIAIPNKDGANRTVTFFPHADRAHMNFSDATHDGDEINISFVHYPVGTLLFSTFGETDADGNVTKRKRDLILVAPYGVALNVTQFEPALNWMICDVRRKIEPSEEK